MSFFCTFTELASTFPARGLAINGTAPKHDAYIGIHETVCIQCGKTFSYHPGEHRYVRYTHSREHKLCSWSCCRAWDKERGNKTEKRIKDLEKRLEYLKQQATLAPNERAKDAQGDICDLIIGVEQRLNTAYIKRAKKAVAEL